MTASEPKHLYRKDKYLRGIELETKVMGMRRAGYSPKDIAAELKTTVAQVGKAIRRALGRCEAYNERETTLFRQLELERLDEMQEAVYEQGIGKEYRIVPTMDGRDVAVKKTDLESLKFVMTLMGHRARLLGLEAPRKVEAKVETTNAIDEQIAKLLEERRGESGEPQPRCQVSTPLEIASPTGAIDATGFEVEELVDTGGPGLVTGAKPVSERKMPPITEFPILDAE